MGQDTGRTFFLRSPSAEFAGPFKKIKIIEEATFATLVMQFPTASSDITTADPSGGVIFPILYELYEVKSFRLATGTVEVVRAV